MVFRVWRLYFLLCPEFGVSISEVSQINHYCSILSQVNTNGHISFSGPNTDFSPVPFSISISRDLIAPFWTDIDTSGPTGGVISYREARDQASVQRAQQEIRDLFPETASDFVARLVFIATWDNVEYFGLSFTGQVLKCVHSPSLH